MADDEDEHWM